MRAPCIPPSPGQVADEAVRQVLRAQFEGVAAVRLDAPPGSGKTGVVERVAAQSLHCLGERCMIATCTNEQEFDLARRLARRYRSFATTLLVRERLPVPDDLMGLPNLQIVRKAWQIPPGPCIVVANAVLWSWAEVPAGGFDLLVVDEAFQLPDYEFHQIAGAARRLLLVGDPEQIAPVIASDTRRWHGDPAGPHVPAPQALLARHPGIWHLRLPVSRRLVPDTVRLLQPAFYPAHPFGALSAPGERRVQVGSSGRSFPPDRAIDRAGEGASLVQLELPGRVTGEEDGELAATIAGLVQRLLARGIVLHDGPSARPLQPGMVGVVCAHVSQVNAVRARLPGHLSGEILVETANRYQGLERPVMLAWHPLSGRAEAGPFHLDAGRLCVTLSRHRFACFLAARAGVEGLLLRCPPRCGRVLGARDAEYSGWEAHLALLRSLRQEGRVVPAS